MEEKDKNLVEINKSKNEEKNEIIRNNNNKIDLNGIKSILEKIQKDFKEKNYQKVENNYKLLFDEKNIENIENINKEINMIKILNNYAMTLYYQMKYESSAKILFKIIINYDNKNKEAYLLFLRILCDINEYQKANLLLEKVNKIMKNNEEFSQIGKEIETHIKIKNNNIKRQFYYNAQEDIFQLKKQLHFFYWCFYSICALIIGHYLSKSFIE